MFGPNIDRGQQDAVHPVLLQDRERPVFLAAVFVACREQHAVAFAAERRLRRPDQAGIKGIRAVGDDETDEPRAAAQKRAREQVGHVTELLCERLHASARLSTHIRLSGQCPRDRVDGNASYLGDVAEAGRGRLRAQDRRLLTMCVCPIRSMWSNAHVDKCQCRRIGSDRRGDVAEWLCS